MAAPRPTPPARSTASRRPTPRSTTGHPSRPARPSGGHGERRGQGGRSPSRLLWVCGSAASAAGLGLALAQAGTVAPPLWAQLSLGACLAGLGGALAWALGRAPTPSPNASAAPPAEPALLASTADARLSLDLQGTAVAGSLQTTEDALRALAALADPRGLPLWQQPGVRIDAETLLRLREGLTTQRGWRRLDWRWTDPAQRPWHFRSSAVPRHDAEGRCLGFELALIDLSVETRLQGLFERLPTPLLMHRQGRVVDANAAALQLLGLPALAALQQQPVASLFEEGQDAAEPACQAALRAAIDPEGDAVGAGEFHLQGGGDGPRVIRLTSVHADGREGPVTLSILVDDSARRASEEAVLRSEALLSHLVATSPDVITLTELATGRYAMVNPTFCRITGWAAEDVIGKTALELGIWHDPADRDKAIARIREDGAVQNLPVRFRTRTGRVVPLLMSAARFEMDGRDYLVINSRDMSETEQLRLEYQAIIENALIGIAMTRHQHFTMTNPRFEQMLGWSPGSLIGEPTSVVWPDRESLSEVQQLIQARVADGGQIELERPLRRRDGSLFWSRLLGRALHPANPSGAGLLWLVEDITERREIDRALARARDEAEAASRAKSAFLANTSHEIRTPLNALLGLARLARQPELDEQRRRDYVEQIADSATTLSDIISDILDLSKIEAGKMHLDAQPFELGALLHSLAEAYGALADAKGLSLHFSRDPALPPVVVGDPVRLRQILSNYLNNALKFTQQGQIRLVARRAAGERLHFEVHDTGPGITVEDQSLLFNPFTQVDDALHRQIGGTGLGLSICRQLAELMGGQVGLHSRPGQGSCFWAELPLPEGQLDDLETTTGSEGLDPIVGARILMVEDNSVNMMIAAALLSQWEAEVVQATDGTEALEAVAQADARGRPFDAVLMDVQMPRMGGHEATRVLRRTHSARRLPIIALTAAALVSERDEALAAGMNDFLTKPIDAERLRRTLIRVLRRARSG